MDGTDISLDLRILLEVMAANTPDCDAECPSRDELAAVTESAGEFLLKNNTVCEKLEKDASENPYLRLREATGTARETILNGIREDYSSIKRIDRSGLFSFLVHGRLPAGHRLYERVMWPWSGVLGFSRYELVKQGEPLTWSLPPQMDASMIDFDGTAAALWDRVLFNTEIEYPGGISDVISRSDDLKVKRGSDFALFDVRTREILGEIDMRPSVARWNDGYKIIYWSYIESIGTLKCHVVTENGPMVVWEKSNGRMIVY